MVERLIDLGLRPEMIIGVGHSLGAHIFPPITTAFEQRNLGKLFMVWGRKILSFCRLVID